MNKLECSFLIVLSLLLLVGCTLPVQPSEDIQLQRQVTHEILAATQIRSDGITLSVKNGVVMLHGSVKSGYERAAVARVVGNVEGVVGVYNRIEVIK